MKCKKTLTIYNDVITDFLKNSKLKRFLLNVIETFNIEITINSPNSI